jgi:hypothetical protein
MNYEEQTDAHSKFYADFDNIINETIAREFYNEAIRAAADENDWNGEDWDEFKDENEWYRYNRQELGFQAEEEALEEVIRKVFEDAGINVNRLSGDEYLDFEDHVKENYPFLDPEVEPEEDEEDDDIE